MSKAIIHAKSSARKFGGKDVFGVVLVNSEGREVVVKDIAEQHIIEDLGYIPSFSEYCEAMEIKPFMLGAKTRKYVLVD
jgi:hypothetical protein